MSLFKYSKELSLRNIFVYYAVATIPYLLLILATVTDLIDPVVFVIGLALWVIFYHPLITGMRRHLLTVRKLMETRLEMQELTYEHISKEIHDNINLSLIISRMHLYRLNEYEKEEREEKVTAAMDLITRSLEELTTLGRSLGMERFKRDTLFEVVREEVSQLRLRSLLDVNIQLEGELVSLGVEREMQLFRIVQESLKNIIRHAEAKNVTILFQYNPRYLDLTIRDDGKGFEYIPDVTEKNSAGLRNIRLRVKVLNGKFILKSAPGQGTSVSVWVRYKEIKNNRFFQFLTKPEKSV